MLLNYVATYVNFAGRKLSGTTGRYICVVYSSNTYAVKIIVQIGKADLYLIKISLFSLLYLLSCPSWFWSNSYITWSIFVAIFGIFFDIDIYCSLVESYFVLFAASLVIFTFSRASKSIFRTVVVCLFTGYFNSVQSSLHFYCPTNC